MSFDTALRRGLVACSKKGGCTNTCEPLSPAARQTFDLFRELQNRWSKNDYNGARRFIPMSEIRGYAEVIGYELTEFDLVKFAVMERVLVDYDLERLAEEQQK